MKRVVLVLLLLCMMLAGCQDREYNILSYQDKNIVAQCTVNEKYSVTLEKTASECKLTVNSPARLEGISFEIGDDYAKATYNDVSIDVDKSDLNGICALANMFSLTEAGLTSAKEGEKGEESLLSFENTYGIYQVTLGANSMPQRVIIQSPLYSYEITVNTIEIKQ